MLNRSRWAVLAALCAGCNYAPLAPVPEPLPEALEWRVEQQEGEGAFLGLETRENDSGSLDALFFEPGLRVTRVVQNSPAARAGIAIGDVLLSFDGRAVDDPEALQRLLARSEPAHRARLEIRRDDVVHEVFAELAPHVGGTGAEAQPLYRIDRARTRAGWADGPAGVVLVSSAPGGPMEEAGIPLGSVVATLDGKEVLSSRELVRELERREPGSEVRLGLRGEGGAIVERELRLQEQPTRLTGAGIPILFHYDADAAGRRAEFDFIDLWIFSVYSYRRDGKEKESRILHFIRWSTGVGELSE